MQRTRCNLAGTGRLSVDKHHHGHHRVDGFHRGLIFPVGPLEFAFGLHQRDALGHPEVDNIHSLGQRPASVASQVEHQAGGSLLLEVDEGAAHVLGAALGIFREIDIADAVIPHAIVGHIGHGDALARDFHAHLLLGGGTEHLEQESGSGFSPEPFAHLRDVLRGHVIAVDAQDDIPLLQSGLGSRHTGVGFVDDDALEFLVEPDDGSDTGILARDHHFQVFGLFLGIIGSVGVETAQHPLDAVADDLTGIERVDIHQVETLVELVEDIQVLSHLQIMVFFLLGSGVCSERT